MKVRMLVERKGPNPAFNPPDPRIDKNAWMTYKYRVSPDIVHPAGTIIDDPWAWVLCMPDAGMVAEPVDDAAKLMVHGEYGTLPLAKKRIFDATVRRREMERPKPVEAVKEKRDA